MKNNNKGVTLVALIATLVVIGIIITTVVISYDSILSDTKKSEFAKEVYLVKKSIEEYKFMNSKYPLDSSITLDITPIDASLQTQFEDEPGYSSKSINLYTIDLLKAGVETVTRGKLSSGSTDVYAFSTNTKKVYYIKGEKINGDVYYTLTDELYKKIGISEVE